MRNALILLSLLISGCGHSSGRSQYGGQYAAPPSSDDEMFKRLQQAASQGATFENVVDRAGFSASQKAAFERGRAQGFRDINGK